VETELGHGTTVRVFLPFVQPAPVMALSADSPKSILVVEPDDFNRKVLRRLLDLMGYSVVTAVDANAALKAVVTDGRKFDLLLADLRNGPIGAEALHRSLKIHLPDLRMVVLDVSPTRTGSASAGRVLQPPYDVDRVANVIQNALEGPLGV
jgi:CheY-like chemotaxis protein